MAAVIDDSREQARLLWQCRRGMLELDLMLMPFVQEQFYNLDTAERDALRSLLSYPDQQLLDILMGQGVPHDRDVANVAKQIRESAGS
jgi:antitoxin CptB